jgi:hypothetical protein
MSKLSWCQWPCSRCIAWQEHWVGCRPINQRTLHYQGLTQGRNRAINHRRTHMAILKRVWHRLYKFRTLASSVHDVAASSRAVVGDPSLPGSSAATSSRRGMGRGRAIAATVSAQPTCRQLRVEGSEEYEVRSRISPSCSCKLTRKRLRFVLTSFIPAEKDSVPLKTEPHPVLRTLSDTDLRNW